jgi:hypothetical protein
MTSKKNAPVEGLRHCIGSAKFGIEAHEAPVSDFPSQPSQKDGLGRLCRPHWAEYTRALRKAAMARQPVPAAVAEGQRAQANNAETKATKIGKAKPPAKPAAKSATDRTGKPGRRAAEAAASAEHDAALKAEVIASAPDSEAAAEQDAILVERRQRVKAWRKSELERTTAKGPDCLGRRQRGHLAGRSNGRRFPIGCGR